MSAPEAGVLPILKPVGPTSHDVVVRARRWFPGRRVGHLGTLDPAAGGLLLLAVGEATRAARLLDPPETVKRYRAWAVFGLETEGDDADGAVTARRGAPGLTAERVAEVLAGRVGRHLQVPPSRSAVRVGGRHAYSRARDGEAPALAPREVVLASAAVLAERRPPQAPDLLEVLLEAHFWRGGYMRALVRDLGRDVGTGASVRVLVRGRVGELDGGAALTLGEAEALAASGGLRSALVPVDHLLARLPAAVVPFDPDGRHVGRGRAAPTGVAGWVRLCAHVCGPAWALGEARDGRWFDLVRLRPADDAEVAR